MKVSDLTKRALAYRRQRRTLLGRGYEEITMAFGIGKLWELDRGGRIGWKVVDAVVGADGRSVFVKAEPPVISGTVGQSDIERIRGYAKVIRDNPETDEEKAITVLVGKRKPQETTDHD